MSLTSALTTALTGMSAAETMIDVDGNNIANSNTVGFKASTASFATQFLQTQSLGSTPTTNNGGTNPRQIGMGTMVADITPNFSQGTVEISSNPTDMAIQGDGFFIVQSQTGGQEYTRNGVFKMNAQNELTTSTGNRLLGYGVDKSFQIQTTKLVPITIPLGSVQVAKATANVQMQGSLSSSGKVATAAQIIESGVLGDASYMRPSTTATSPKTDISTQVALPNPTTKSVLPAAGLSAGTYYYAITYSDANPPTISAEGTPSNLISATTDATNNAIVLPTDQLPTPTAYQYVNIYRSTTNNVSDFKLLTTMTKAAAATPYTDDGTATIGAAGMNNQTISGKYTYYIAYADANGLVSRPCDAIAAPDAQNGRVHLTNLPAPDSADTHPWTQYVIYRNYSGSGSNFVEVDRVNISDPNPTYTDSIPDSTLVTRAADSAKILNFNGPPATAKTRLVDLVNNQKGTTYAPIFSSSGTLQFTGQKGGHDVAARDLTVVGSNPPASSDTHVSDLLEFMTESLGIQKHTDTNGVPPSIDTAHPSYPPINPDAYIDGGVISLVGNNGTANAVDIGSMKFVNLNGSNPVNMPFTKYQDAVGESTSADFVAYDSLGISCNVRVTADLEKEDSTGTVYRWYADSSDNQMLSGDPSVAVGTGTITFDGKGNFVSATNDKISINRDETASVSPLIFKLDFSNISGLAADSSTLQAKSQDGSPPGTLTSFIVGGDGRITGVFSNGNNRDVAQIRLARFSNPAGLEQMGQNVYVSGVNSGLPVEGNPGQQGIGTIVAGAVELSNTDIGGSLTDLILASTMYRGNARVITTTQQLFDELLALKR